MRLLRNQKGGLFQPFQPPMPRAPKTASPVPQLTSLHNCSERGPWGDARYPGNCGGQLIKDVLMYFRPKSVFDPMQGSGTCRDVCAELRIPHYTTDLREGFDASDRYCYPDALFDFVWMHPPYWRQKVYSSDPRDLSRAPTLRNFLWRYGQVIENCAGVLAPGGHIAILMGDYSDREEGFCPLVYHTKRLCFQAGLHQTCTDIVRFSHGASSSRRTYDSSFIPGLHDVLTIVEHSKQGGRR